MIAIQRRRVEEERLVGNLRLLVGDDDGDTRTMLGRVLAECGALVDQASSAAEARSVPPG